MFRSGAYKPSLQLGRVEAEAFAATTGPGPLASLIRRAPVLGCAPEGMMVTIIIQSEHVTELIDRKRWDTHMLAPPPARPLPAT
ncbi:hypothetical protein IP70_22445 [alpha proteobacterium AAP38]|nr:hypothetical protein IP70_22445 [alpha proteobacterium AAP38]